MAKGSKVVGPDPPVDPQLFEVAIRSALMPLEITAAGGTCSHGCYPEHRTSLSSCGVSEVEVRPPRTHMLQLGQDILSQVIFHDLRSTSGSCRRIVQISHVCRMFQAATSNPLLWKRLMAHSWRHVLSRPLNCDWRASYVEVELRTRQRVRGWESLFLHHEPEAHLWQYDMQEFVAALQTVNEQAAFLWNHPMNKQMLGEFLGSTASDKVRASVLAKLDLQGTDIVGALQQLFGKMTTRTASALDRLVRQLSHNYHEVNMKHLASPNAVHTLMYAALMLNTDMYNGNIKQCDKMTQGCFVQSVLRMREGDEPFVPIPVIDKIYNRLSKDGPFQINKQGDKEDKETCLSIGDGCSIC